MNLLRQFLRVRLAARQAHRTDGRRRGWRVTVPAPRASVGHSQAA